MRIRLLLLVSVFGLFVLSLFVLSVFPVQWSVGRALSAVTEVSVPDMPQVPLSGGSEGTTYVYGPALVARSGEGLTYALQERVGSNSLWVRSDGVLSARVLTYPYGKSLVVGSFDAPPRFVFAGKETDGSLYYMGARYYDARTGRFLSVDQVLENPSFAYADDNPLQFKDDDGKSPTLVAGAVGFVAGGVIGGAINVGIQMVNMRRGNQESIDWGDVGRSALTGAVSGGVAGLTAGGSLVAGVGSGVVSGRAARVTENVLEKRAWSEAVFDPLGIAVDAVSAGAGHALGSAVQQARSASREVSRTANTVRVYHGTANAERILESGRVMSQYDQYVEMGLRRGMSDDVARDRAFQMVGGSPQGMNAWFTTNPGLASDYGSQVLVFDVPLDSRIGQVVAGGGGHGVAVPEGLSTEFLTDVITVKK